MIAIKLWLKIFWAKVKFSHSINIHFNFTVHKQCIYQNYSNTTGIILWKLNYFFRIYENVELWTSAFFFNMRQQGNNNQIHDIEKRCMTNSFSFAGLCYCSHQLFSHTFLSSYQWSFSSFNLFLNMEGQIEKLTNSLIPDN